ncbi:MAG: phytoene synthase, partial [Nitrosomonas sp.]|nr:phytoene synthase [Nitrosomonas sp.]
SVLTLNKINQHRDFHDGIQVKIKRSSVKATIIATSLFASHNWALNLLFRTTARNLPNVELPQKSLVKL